MPLTEAEIKAFAPEKKTNYTDGAGLYLVVDPKVANGEKYFVGRSRYKAGRVLDSIVRAKSDYLGQTEWRTWPYSIESLIESANKIVELTICDDTWTNSQSEESEI